LKAPARGLALKWRGRKVSNITKCDIIAQLDEQVARGIGANANRLRAALLLFFGWCLRRELVIANPCAGVDPPVAEQPRDRVLTDDELALFWRASAEDVLFGPMWRILALTGQRRDEARGMSWAELDLEKGLWTIPAARTKNGREHVVPLSTLSVEILQAQPRIGGKRAIVFTTTGDSKLGGLSRAKTRLDARMLAIGRQHNSRAKMTPWVIHDLRRTCASGMQKLGIALPVIEKILNHTSGSFAGIVGIYQRHEFLDEKRSALDAWARHIQALIDPVVGNVVPLRRGPGK
jgi:integrase